MTRRVCAAWLAVVMQSIPWSCAVRCDGNATFDIVFLLDASRSIHPMDWAFSVSFASDLVEALPPDRGPVGGVRAAVVLYSAAAAVAFDYSAAASVAGGFREVIAGLTQTGTTSRLDLGLATVLGSELNGGTETATGYRNRRTVLIIFSDGLSSIPQAVPPIAAQIQAIGWEVYAVGLGPAAADRDGAELAALVMPLGRVWLAANVTVIEVVTTLTQGGDNDCGTIGLSTPSSTMTTAIADTNTSIATLPSTTTAGALNVPECYDANPGCPSIAADGACSPGHPSSLWAEYNCAFSCGACNTSDLLKTSSQVEQYHDVLYLLFLLLLLLPCAAWWGLRGKDKNTPPRKTATRWPTEQLTNKPPETDGAPRPESLRFSTSRISQERLPIASEHDGSRLVDSEMLSTPISSDVNVQPDDELAEARMLQSSLSGEKVDQTVSVKARQNSFADPTSNEVYLAFKSINGILERVQVDEGYELAGSGWERDIPSPDDNRTSVRQASSVPEGEAYLQVVGHQQSLGKNDTLKGLDHENGRGSGISTFSNNHADHLREPEPAERRGNRRKSEMLRSRSYDKALDICGSDELSTAEAAVGMGEEFYTSASMKDGVEVFRAFKEDQIWADRGRARKTSEHEGNSAVVDVEIAKSSKTPSLPGPALPPRANAKGVVSKREETSHVVDSQQMRTESLIRRRSSVDSINILIPEAPYEISAVDSALKEEDGVTVVDIDVAVPTTYTALRETQWSSMLQSHSAKTSISGGFDSNADAQGQRQCEPPTKIGTAFASPLPVLTQAKAAPGVAVKIVRRSSAASGSNTSSSAIGTTRMSTAARNSISSSPNVIKQASTSIAEAVLVSDQVMAVTQAQSRDTVNTPSEQVQERRSALANDPKASNKDRSYGAHVSSQTNTLVPENGTSVPKLRPVGPRTSPKPEASPFNRKLSARASRVFKDEDEMLLSLATTSRVLAPTPTTQQKSMQTKLQTVAEILAESQDDGEWERLDNRAIEAAKWTDAEIARVVTEIKRRGYKNTTGRPEITFGQLFQETDSIFDALAGILKTCKKYKVVSFEGEQLWQGPSNAVKIEVLDENFKGIKIKRRRKSALHSAPTNRGGFGKGFVDGNCCDRCKKIVYALEYVGAGGRTYHRECFRCAGLSTGKDCDAVLAMNNYFVAADGKHRCKKCHIAFERARF